ncbi:MAG: DUF4878 domain-containing protein [Clostridia bacterium]|nr:DUF4878 domain-containing protein [Clostridia bacterium]
MNKKRFLCLLSAVMLLLITSVMTGCGQGDSPSGAVKGFLEAFRNQNSEDMAKYYEGISEDGWDMDEMFNELESEEIGLDKDCFKSLMDKISDIEYTIGEEKTDGDKATVEVTVKAYDFSAFFTDWIEAAISEAGAISGTIGDLSEEEVKAKMNKIFRDAFIKNLNGMKEKTHEATVTVQLQNKDGAWKIKDEGNGEDSEEISGLQDAVTGGLLSGMSSLMQM